jgi:hypothetical protein
MTRYGKKATEKVERAMHEPKRGALCSSRSGKKVTSRRQAIAIGLAVSAPRGRQGPAAAHAAEREVACRTS